MKMFLAALAVLFTFAMPVAARAPSGYEVKGCPHYILINNQVVHVCHWRVTHVGWSNPQSRVNTGGE